MTIFQTADTTRLPLNTRRATSTFGMSVLGLLTANLLPFMVIVVLAVLIFNLIADVMYAVLDPRIRLD